MIQCITEQNKVSTLQAQDPFLCRILCIATMYGVYPFADCWVQVQEDHEKPLAYVSKLDGVITLFTTPNADFDEIGSFLDAIGYSLVMCHKACADRLGIKPTRTGAILKWQGIHIEKKQNILLDPGLQQVYEVLMACESADFQPPAFEPFYLDMSHKVRHKGAKVVGFEKNKQLAACAMTVAQTEQTAVIGAVAVKPDYQGQGLGKTILKGLLNMCLEQNQKAIYVTCNTRKNQQFYESLGFISCGTWAELEHNKKE